MSSLVGNRFEILSLAGQGGMGRVFRAWDTLDSRVVALKLLRLDLDPEAHARFRRESDALARLQHPGIVRYVAHGATEDGVPYLAMEWLEGEELRARLKRDRRLDLPAVLALGTRIAGALAHAHEHGIIHRDVKPSNVILPDEDPTNAVLIDFGLARTGEDEVTRAGMIVGTPTYMAPEQIRDEGVTPSIDVFALGCVLYESLAQVTPFGATGATAVLARVLFGDASPLALIAPEVPLPFALLVDRMLRKNPAERPSMLEVVIALGNLEGTVVGRSSESTARLSTVEQRVVAVIVAGAATTANALDTLRLSIGALEKVDFTPLRQIGGRFGAEISRLPNGAVIAVLQSRGAATDLAARAAECALALKAELGDTPVGLATGRAEVGEGLPIGEAIDRAVALPGLAGAGVRIDDVTKGLLGPDFVQTADADGTLVVGRSAAPDPTRMLLGKPTPFVGRDAELATLEGIVRQSESESVARAILVTATAGAGKSRIARELLARISSDDERTIWVSRAGSVGAGAPFGMLARIIRRAANVLDAEAVGPSREKLLALGERVASDAEARRIAMFLGEMIGVRFEADDVQLRAARNDARLMGDQMQRAFVDLVEHASSLRPLVIVLDDLQWGDAPTVAALGTVLRVLEERPLAIIAFARPEVTEVFPELWSGRGVLPLPLGPLPKKAAGRLARAVLGDAHEEKQVTRLVEQAAGNAFLLEELLRAEVEGRGGEVPPTVVATVQSRLGALEPEARRVLRAASVLGETFRSGGLFALLGDDARDADRWLDELCRREVITPLERSRVGPSTEYVFRHSLVRDGAYAMLTDADRALGHRLAAEWLERAQDASPVVIATHYELAGDRARASVARLRAAEQALESSDLGGAVEHAERGAALGATGTLLGALRVVKAHAHHWRGETEAMESAASEAVTLLPRDEPRWADAMTMLAVAKQRLGDTSELESVATRLAEMLSLGVGDRAALARAGGRVSSLLFFAGKQEAALGMLDTAEAAARGGGLDVEARIYQARAPQARQAGQPERALRHAEAAAAAFQTAGDRRNACMMTGICGFAMSELGAYEAAERLLTEALRTANLLGLTTVAATSRSNLGVVYLRLGRSAEAEATVRSAVSVFESNDRRHEGGSRAYLAMILFARGALREAEAEARASLTLLDAALALRPLASAILADLLLTTQRATEALATIQEAIRWSDDGGNIEEGDSLVRLTFARALLATGNPAEHVIADARDRLLERAATISNEGLRRTFLENIPAHRETLALAEQRRS